MIYGEIDVNCDMNLLRKFLLLENVSSILSSDMQSVWQYLVQALQIESQQLIKIP